MFYVSEENDKGEITKDWYSTESYESALNFLEDMEDRNPEMKLVINEKF